MSRSLYFSAPLLFLPFSASLGHILVDGFKPWLGETRERKLWNGNEAEMFVVSPKPITGVESALDLSMSAKLPRYNMLSFTFCTFRVFLWSGWSQCSERSIGCYAAVTHWYSQNGSVLSITASVVTWTRPQSSLMGRSSSRSCPHCIDELLHSDAFKSQHVAKVHRTLKSNSV